MLLSVGSSEDANTPQLVYGTYLGGRDKECATGIAVDRSGAAYIAGRTPSPDFPVTPGSFSTTTRVDNNDWTGFVSKISECGDHLLYSSFIGGNFRSTVNAIAVDLTGRVFVAGSTCSSNFPTPFSSRVNCKVLSFHDVLACSPTRNPIQRYSLPSPGLVT